MPTNIYAFNAEKHKINDTKLYKEGNLSLV